jgi:hypothetical protein
MGAKDTGSFEGWEPEEERGLYVKKLSLYEDSDVWGSDPATGERFPEDARRPEVPLCGPGYGYRVLGAIRKDARARPRRFREHYRLAVRQYGCNFLNASVVMAPSILNVNHPGTGTHRKLVGAVAAPIKGTLDEASPNSAWEV